MPVGGSVTPIGAAATAVEEGVVPSLSTGLLLGLTQAPPCAQRLRPVVVVVKERSLTTNEAGLGR